MGMIPLHLEKWYTEFIAIFPIVWFHFHLVALYDGDGVVGGWSGCCYFIGFATTRSYRYICVVCNAVHFVLSCEYGYIQDKDTRLVFLTTRHQLRRCMGGACCINTFVRMLSCHMLRKRYFMQLITNLKLLSGVCANVVCGGGRINCVTSHTLYTPITTFTSNPVVWTQTASGRLMVVAANATCVKKARRFQKYMSEQKGNIGHVTIEGCMYIFAWFTLCDMRRCPYIGIIALLWIIALLCNYV